MRNNREAVVSVEEIASICDGDFGYTASIIINSICEILKSNDTIDEENEIECLMVFSSHTKRLSMRAIGLKYLPSVVKAVLYK